MFFHSSPFFPSYSFFPSFPLGTEELALGGADVCRGLEPSPSEPLGSWFFVQVKDLPGHRRHTFEEEALIRNHVYLTLQVNTYYFYRNLPHSILLHRSPPSLSPLQPFLRLEMTPY